jgi:hypothetical protein
MEREMNKTEAAAELRSYIKAHGVNARVHGVAGAGRAVVVSVPTYEARFTAAEIEFFSHTARDIGLTLVRGMPINPAHQAQLTDKTSWEFHLPTSREAA